jgi:hypothetical protein
LAALRRRIEECHKAKGGAACGCLESAFYLMTADNAAFKNQLLCAQEELPELRIGDGEVPKLHRKQCADGSCTTCGWDEETSLRRLWPEEPSCFAAMGDESIKWDEVVKLNDEGAPKSSCVDSDDEEEDDEEDADSDEEEEEDGSDDDDEEDDEEDADSDEEEEEDGSDDDDDEEDDEEVAADSDEEEGAAPEPEPKTKPKAVHKKSAMATVSGKQSTFIRHFTVYAENTYLPHSRRCKSSNINMARRIHYRKDWEIIAETDFSNNLEFRPQDAECCKFYNQCSLVPFVVYYTDRYGSRRTEVHIACSSDLRNNFAVHQHLLKQIIKEKIIPNMADKPKRLTVVTDNCRKQYRNRFNYGFIADFCADFGMELLHLFLCSYHGKGVSDGICGILKEQAKNEIMNKDSLLEKKSILGTYVQLALWADGKYKSDNDKRKTDKYQLYVLSKHEESELKVDLGDVVDAGCAGCVGDDGITNYKKQVVDNDMEQHSFYSQCTYEHGDLRSVAEICGCDGCIDGKYSHCPLMARSGDRIVQYYLPPIKGPQQDEEAQRLAGAAAAFCMSTVADQLVVVPCWRGRKKGGAQVNYLAKLAAAPPPPPPAAAAGGRAAAAASGGDTGRATRSTRAAGKMPAQAERGAATAPVARDTEDGWPPHMYYKAAGTTSEKRAVMDCVWYEPHPTELRRYVQCAAQSKVLLCAQVVPVKIPGAITEPVDGTAGGGFLLDPSAVSFIEGLNLLRFT